MAKELSEWVIESLRLSIFFNPPIIPSQCEEWLKTATSSEPSQIQKGPFGFEGVAIHEGLFVRLRGVPGRLDWILHAEPSNEITSIGSSDKLLPKFEIILGVLSKLTNWPIASRLAVGGGIYRQVDSQADGNSLLSSLLPQVNIDVDTVQDFLYRVNRPSISKSFASLQINNLATWQIALLQVVSFSVPVMQHPVGRIAGDPFPMELIAEPKLVCKVEFDINTDKNVDLLYSTSDQLKIVNEMIGNMEFLAKNGDTDLKLSIPV